MTQPSKPIEELKAKVAAGKARRAAKTAESLDAAAMRRLENEARLVDIEAETGLTVGVDLGVVWCRNGEMVAVKMPDQLPHERYVLKCANGAVTAKDVDQYLEDAILHPPKGFRESLWAAEPQAKIAAVEVAQSLREVAEKVTAGK